MGKTLTFDVNVEEWLQAEACTPEHKPSPTATQEEATKKAGNCVKTRETAPDGFPLMTGILVNYGKRCVVRGWGDRVSPKFVWKGSQAEYLAMWIAD